MHVLEGSAWSATMLAVFLSFLSMLSPWYFDKTSSPYSHLGPWLRWNLFYTPSYTGIPHNGHLGEVFTTCRTTTMLAVISSWASLFCLAANRRTQKADQTNITWLLCAVIAEFLSVVLDGVSLIVWLMYLRIFRGYIMVQLPFSFLICHLLSSVAGAVLCLLLYLIRHKPSGADQCTCGQQHGELSTHLGVLRTAQGGTIDLDRFAENIRQRDFLEREIPHGNR